ncbi:MAG TPA: glycoside hydrolase [Tepidisphaeraceae bacterium]|jgi:autotransporter-associated beta strand protein
MAVAGVGGFCAVNRADAGGSIDPTRMDTFDLAVVNQTMEYFGASDAWYAQTVGGWNSTARSGIADLLFSQTSGIGLSCWRFNIGGGIDPGISIPQRTADTFETGQGTYDWTKCANERWFLAAAKGRGVPQYVAFSNSPTRRMTKNGHTYADSTVGTTNLKTGYEGQFAKYLVDVVKHFRDNPDATQRVNFSYISPVNEPEWDWNGNTQEGTRWSVSDIKNVTNALYSELANQSVSSQILIAEAGQIQDMYSGPSYVDAFAGDASVNTKLGQRLTYHSYWSDDPTTQLVQTRALLAAKLAQYPGWKAGESEYSILGDNGPGRDLTMTTALNVARVIHYDLTVANSTAWTWWLAMSAANWKDGLIYLDMNTQTYQASKTLWALGNYSRFIRPGAKRVTFAGDNTNVNGLLASAYKNTSTGDFDVVYVNELTTAQPVKLNLTNVGTGLKLDYVTPYVTSDAAGDDLKQYTSILMGDSYTVPAKSVVTLAGGTFNENNDGKVISSLFGSKSYTLGGGTVTFNPGAGTFSGSLSGSGGLAKSGAGTMLLGGTNSYNGSTIVNGGVLKMNSASALGSSAGGTTVNAGGTLDLNGYVTEGETLTIAGSGSGGQGALISNGGDVWNDGVRNLVLSADATIGGNARWNVRTPSGPVPAINGNGHDLTKVGANEIWLTGCSINNLGNITVNEGKLGLENLVGGLGMANRTITVSGGTLGLIAATPANFAKNLALAGGTVANYLGNVKFTGSVSVTGENTVDSGPDALTFDGPMSGAGSITKLGTGTLEIRGAGEISGNTSVNGGTLVYGAKQRMSNLSIGEGASAIVSKSGQAMLHVDTLNLSGGAKLDLNDNDLIVENGDYETISQLRWQGYRDSEDSNVTGIISSAGQTLLGHPILAVFNNALLGASDWPWGSGNTLGANAVVGQFAYIGDADLNGMVTPDDYTAVDSNLGQWVGFEGGMNWFAGDWNFDGMITPDDYLAIDSNLGLGEGNPLAAQGMAALGMAAVPEPGSVAAVVAVGAVALRHRRRVQG